MWKKNLLVIDMDGTVSEYRSPDDCIILRDLYQEGIFENQKPMTQVIDRIENILNDTDSDGLILSMAPTFDHMKEKDGWLDINMKYIDQEDIYFIGYNPDQTAKIQYIESILNKRLTNNMEYDNVIFIDDNHQILRAAEQNGFKALHVSSLLIDDYMKYFK